MDPTNFFGRDILEVLSQLRAQEEIVDYSKIEGDEFLKLPEKGFYLHSKNGDGKRFDCRIYFSPYEEYCSSESKARGQFAGFKKINELEMLLGRHTREIRSIKIPGRPVTLSGKEFHDDGRIVTAFAKDGENITYLHIKTVDN